MKKQEIIEKYTKIMIIENCSKQTIINQLSSLNFFLEYIKKFKTGKIDENDIKNYLYYCKT